MGKAKRAHAVLTSRRTRGHGRYAPLPTLRADAHAFSFRRNAGRGSLPPGFERLGEGAFAGRPLLDGEDGAAAVLIDQRDVEPRPVLEQLNVALTIALDRGQADQEE